MLSKRFYYDYIEYYLKRAGKSKATIARELDVKPSLITQVTKYKGYYLPSLKFEAFAKACDLTDFEALEIMLQKELESYNDNYCRRILQKNKRYLPVIEGLFAGGKEEDFTNFKPNPLKEISNLISQIEDHNIRELLSSTLGFAKQRYQKE